MTKELHGLQVCPLYGESPNVRNQEDQIQSQLLAEVLLFQWRWFSLCNFIFYFNLILEMPQHNVDNSK